LQVPFSTKITALARRATRFVAIAALGMCPACGVEDLFFPPVDTLVPLEAELAERGPYRVMRHRIELDDLGDGTAGGVTVFAPTDAPGVRPALLWVLGINNRAHFHQSLHETLAGWGFVVAVPDTRDFRLLDLRYHERNVDSALNVLALLIDGALVADVAPERVAIGGYSVGATMAAVAAGRDARVTALLLWAPSPAPIWLGIEPRSDIRRVAAPTMLVLGDLDDVVGTWPSEVERLIDRMDTQRRVIENGVHLYFQQPAAVDGRNPATPITRSEQMGLAIDASRTFLLDILDGAGSTDSEEPQ